MKKFGLIGFPLGHSFSKAYFSEKFKKENIRDCQYDNYPLEDISSLQKLIRDNTELIGLNVTIPHKQAVIPLLNEMDNEAAAIGAVNTIKISLEKGDPHLIGYNTDIYGFENPLLEVLSHEHKKALILGTGGASKAVEYILQKHHVECCFVSRNPKVPKVFSYENLTEELIAQFQIIVNTSPIGMFPDIDNKPAIPYEGLGKMHILYDLIYNPEKTLFLKEGEKRGTHIINGLPMLHMQAEKAWEIWNS